MYLAPYIDIYGRIIGATLAPPNPQKKKQKSWVYVSFFWFFSRTRG